jgi:hypothetical protein
MVAYCDETREALAGILRPADAGSNLVPDQIAVVEQAFEQIPLSTSRHRGTYLVAQLQRLGHTVTLHDAKAA